MSSTDLRVQALSNLTYVVIKICLTFICSITQVSSTICVYATLVMDLLYV